MALFSQLSWYFISEWRRYVGAIFLLMVIAVLQVIPPKIVGIIVDGVDSHSLSFQQIMGWIGIMVLIALAVYLLRYIWRLWLFGASYQLAVKLRMQIYRQLSLQSSAFYQRYRTGDLIARTTNDVDKVVFAAGEGVLTLVDSMVMGLAVLVMMSIQLSWQLTLISLLPMPLMAILIKRYGDKLHHRFKSAQALFSSLNNQAQESLSSIRMIKSFGLEQQHASRFETVAKETGRQNMRVAKVDALFDPTIFMAIGFANLLAVAGGSYFVLNGTMTLGELTSFVMYLGQMIWPMLALAWMFNIVERGSAAYSRINALLNEQPAMVDGQLSPMHQKGTLAVDIKAFHYPKQQVDVLKNIHFTLSPGDMLGICGMTGAGKSTLLALIQRLYDVSEGDIRFQSVPLYQLKLDEWRGRLAVVNQTPFLFSDTIAGNIALGRPDATKEEIEAVAKIANIHDDILNLPEGYLTQVGEKGVMLSGGQKQRISIARALLLDAEILLLDDALSAVDGQTEYQILQNLAQWRKEKTIIISAHRLSALVDATNILVLKQGEIIEQGTHQTLIAVPGWYQDMYHYQQLEAALDDDK
ncbi:TPA: SmdA family multidrug ABC transporter permease/ATP-binding protein [Proteus mirabilis]|nr:SmdA family multidrug ABC transporter permease/ATP-binding protein [Proteus mirabilis]MBG5956569.1 SmdA family multidrug ABC transporter permease/ATP-binding protein [Proteus mirabilis]HDU8436703.1 SmdA family multidrug ABC transporter permease/ATP-binding protein [Proteus mirabilis]HEJ9529209.1 SmdA family multidrug ABC transporter permease/ATP-binding protein [Proteus mirabilis]HEJ9547841.1 SmdA family multidrug ABC transporter permease/ATP-binding protein [Proteus mirabilis]